VVAVALMAAIFPRQPTEHRWSYTSRGLITGRGLFILGEPQCYTIGGKLPAIHWYVHQFQSIDRRSPIDSTWFAFSQRQTSKPDVIAFQCYVANDGCVSMNLGRLVKQWWNSKYIYYVCVWWRKTKYTSHESFEFSAAFEM